MGQIEATSQKSQQGMTRSSKPDQKPIPILIPMKEVCTLTSLSRTMVNRLRVAGRFPEAVELGERRVAFVRSEVVAWIEERIAGRRDRR